MSAVRASAPTMTFSVTVRSGKGFSFWNVRATPQAGDAVGAQAGDVVAVEEDAAGVERLEAGDQVEQRGLAGAVRADDAEDLALVHVEGDVGVGGKAAVALGHALDVEQQAHAVPPPRRRMRSSNRLRMPLGRHMHTARIRMP